MEYAIRGLTAADEAQWRVLWSDYLAFYATAVSEDVLSQTFQRLIDSEHTAQQALVADADGELLGLVHIIYHAHNWRLEDVCYLQDLYTAPAARGNGVATALIEAVYAAADANATPSVYWLTQDFNHQARRVYDKVAKLTPFIKYQR